VLFAWATNNIALIQIRPILVPMSIHAALGFIFSGLGLILLNVHKSQKVDGVQSLGAALGGSGS